MLAMNEASQVSPTFQSSMKTTTKGRKDSLSTPTMTAMCSQTVPWDHISMGDWMALGHQAQGYVPMAMPASPFASPLTPSHFSYAMSDASQSLPQTPLKATHGSSHDSNDGTQSNGSSPAKENNTNVYISGLPRTVTDESFLELVSQYGSIFSCKVVRKGTQDPPVGFVQYTSPGMARLAVQSINGKLFGGATLKAKMALRDKDKGVDCKPSANLYICNLPPDFTTADLRRAFEPHGRIVSLVALTDPVTGRSRGTGFVRFSSVKEARLAKEMMHGFPLRPELPLEVKFAESNADRAQRLKGRMNPDGSQQGSPLSPPAAFAMPVTPGSPASPMAPPSPLKLDMPSAASESFHKRQRPTPLKSPETMNQTDTAEKPLLEGLGDLKAFLDNVFPPEQHPNVARKLVDDLRTLQKPHQSERNISITSDSWETFGLSDADGSSEKNNARSQSGTSPTPNENNWSALNIWGSDSPWSPNAPVPDTRLWKFTEGTPLDVSFSASITSPMAVTSPAESSSTVKVEGLPLGTTEVDLYRMCSQYGAILQINFDNSPQSCTAFVQFRTPEEARRAQAKLSGFMKDGRTLMVTA